MSATVTRHHACRAAMAAITLTLASCSAVAGTATRAPVPTNGAGLARVFVRPCEQIPHLVLRQQLLDPSPAVVSKHTTASGTETRACTYRSTDRRQHITIIASNNMLDQGQTSLLGADRHELTIGGRRAVSFMLPNSVQPHACEVDLAATTGIYGVQLSTTTTDYAPYRGCVAAAEHYAQAFTPYFPW
ncbi:DUF3558 family protein [Mycobacteroides abscessus subsp. abscessus]|uniref:DUF3558 family protein n=1 Tax=Mycobacteroides abscessus TaxID=36809 RepID=UPI00266C5BA5|nr:DUF3558 family protein [Mycobacteroides abscessus]MDO3340054.1 DUF3558 family protein [Mycobacteroides abscessus subsp. abscessus]